MAQSIIPKNLAADVSALNSKFAIPITNGTNLNSLTSPGFYSCSNGSIAQSLTNCPTVANFAMFVMSKGSYVTQVIFSLGSNIYTRTQTSSGFDHWFVFSGTDTGA